MPNNPDRDHWHVLANRLFLQYIRERLGANPRAWGPVPSYPYGLRHDTVQAHCTRIAVTHKNRFADFLAELEQLPDTSDIRDRWTSAMQCAERDIAAYLATNPTAEHLALT